MNYRIVLKTLGLLMISLSVSLGFPLFWTVYYGTRDFAAILYTMVIALVFGTALYLPNRGAPTEIQKKEGMAVVTMGWLSAALIGALPFRFSGVFDNYIDALFESMSGFTTTGASLITDFEGMPPGIMFWRSLTHWLGGMGIIVLFIAVLPYLGVGGRQLFRSEVPGPVPEGLRPRVQQTARTLWLIYVAFSIAETALLMAGGMSLFDALCHTFGTLATGGFSTKAGSIGEYGNPYFEWVIIFFMLVAGVNFALYFHMLRGNASRLLKDHEFRLYLGILVVAVLLVFFVLFTQNTEPDASEAFRKAAFQVTAILTTTGYATADFDAWPHFIRALLVLLMFVGGCAGSTGGSMKVVRVLIVVKWLANEIHWTFKPKEIRTLRVGGSLVPDPVRDAILGFVLLYVAIFAGGTLLMTFLGCDLTTGFSSVIATLGNIGPGLAGVGPASNYTEIPMVGKIFLSFCMLLGRLELFTVLVLFSPSFWKR